MNKRVDDLITVTQMGLDVELAKLRTIQDQIDERTNTIELIRTEKKRRVDTLTHLGSADFALVSGADQKWLLWQQSQIAKINMELANLRVKKAVQTDIAKAAFGKKQVIQKLSQQQKI